MGLAAALVAGTAVAGIGGALITSSAAGSAADKAAQAAASNNALQQQIYNRNTANATPFMDRGNTAGVEINGLLGLGGNKTAINNAFNTFRHSSGYDFAFNEGQRALDNNLALRGASDSGAAIKAATQYGQNMAVQNAFSPYLVALQRQQDVGLSATNALAGAGTNYANAVSSNNNNAASVAGNAAVASGNAWSNALGSTAGQLTQLFGSSYGNKSGGNSVGMGGWDYGVGRG
jgi:hypothetical protein